MKEPRRPRDEADERLLDACRRGDRAALERVFRQHAAMLHRLLVRLLGNAADADDVLQTTLVQASRAFTKFRGEAAVDTWLSRIAINAARSHMRSAQAPVRATLELVGDDTPSPEQSPEDIIHDRQRVARLHHHLAALSPVKRIAFVLSVVEGMPVEEIAALTGSSVFATKSRIYWAGRALRARARKDALLRDLLVDEPEGDE
jgi:RNA polymerase sigma-70 factor (ECF subfamily)